MLDELQYRAVIEMSDVVCCTLYSAYSSKTYLLKDFDFPVIVVDEASAALEPATLIAFSFAPKKVILVGDHKQLGPIAKSDQAKKQGLERSLFERLMDREKYPSIAFTVLNTQYRMVPGLIEYPSNTFYDGVIKSGAEIQSHSWIKWPKAECPIIFANVKGTEVPEGGSCYNLQEAEAVVELCLKLVKHGKDFMVFSMVESPFVTVDEESIGVIAPYVPQIKHVQRLLNKAGLKRVEIDTVNSFQGREKVITENSNSISKLMETGLYHNDNGED